MLKESSRQEYGKKIKFPPVGFEKWLLDIVAISLVTDMCTLIGENRVLLKYGMIVLKKTKRVGLSELIKISNIKNKDLTTRSIGYQIGPRLNAAGRLDHASTSYKLIMTEKSEEASLLAEQLNGA